MDEIMFCMDDSLLPAADDFYKGSSHSPNWMLCLVPLASAAGRPLGRPTQGTQQPAHMAGMILDAKLPLDQMGDPGTGPQVIGESRRLGATEQGVAMSSVLRSKRAAQVNVAIMRAFVSLRRLLATNETLARKFVELERRLEGHDQAIKSLFNVRELMSPSAKPRREIGFHAIGKEAAAGAKTMSKCKRIEKSGIQRELNVK